MEEKSLKHDPRNSGAVHPFKFEKKSGEDSSFDVWGFAAILFGVIALMSRVWKIFFFFFFFFFFFPGWTERAPFSLPGPDVLVGCHLLLHGEHCEHQEVWGWLQAGLHKSLVSSSFLFLFFFSSFTTAHGLLILPSLSLCADSLWWAWWWTMLQGHQRLHNNPLRVELVKIELDSLLLQHRKKKKKKKKQNSALSEGKMSYVFKWEPQLQSGSCGTAWS